MVDTDGHLLEMLIWISFYVLILVLSIFFLGNWLFCDIIYVTSKYTRGHTWRSIQQNKFIPYNIHCYVCKKLMLTGSGLFCDKCALSACRECHNEASKKKSCKVLIAPAEEPFRHHWTKVGLVCEDCEDDVTNKGSDYFCSWCNTIQHCDKGEPNATEECDFGKLKPVIVPPTCVTINRTKHVSVTSPSWTDWQPIIIVVNPKSGGQIGEDIMSMFRGVLHPIQVVELKRGALKAVLRWAPPQSRFLVAGGDGSASAVLTALSQSGIDPLPAMGVLPLGTGNDMSRVLGWGTNVSIPPSSPLSIIRAVRNATPHLIDRWKIQIGRKTMFAYNYMSVGVDAKVALDFHKARAHPFYLFNGRLSNYLIYLFFGTHQAVTQDCFGLEKLIEFTLDGERFGLPPLQSLLLLNIPSWGAGVNVWSFLSCACGCSEIASSLKAKHTQPHTRGKKPERSRRNKSHFFYNHKGADDNVPQQRIDDGKFEVLGINSSFHIAQLQVGLSQPMRLGQGSKAVIKLSGTAPMQVDGEPWEQGPCVITVEFSGQSTVLIHKKD